MFSMDNLLKMAGVSKAEIEQLTQVQSMLSKLPEDEKKRVVSNFINDLQEAIAKTGEK